MGQSNNSFPGCQDEVQNTTSTRSREARKLRWKFCSLVGIACLSQLFVTTFRFHDHTATNVLGDSWFPHPRPAPIRDLSSSQVELTKWLDLFLPLRNVCFTSQHIHFFQDPEDATSSGETAKEYFVNHAEPPTIFIFWGRERQDSFNPKPVLHKMSMKEWMARRRRNYHPKKLNKGKQLNKGKAPRVSLYNGTSFVFPPHLPGNMFHLFNDLIVPLFELAVRSGSMSRAAKGGYFTGQTESVQTNSNYLFLPRGNPDFYKKRVIMFDILYKLFDTVEYPFEDKVSQGKAVCFNRYIWAQRQKAWSKPYYEHRGRFDEEHDNHWQGILPALRDKVNQVYSIQVPQEKTIDFPNNNLSGTNRKPTFVWASRTGLNAATCDRCIVNEDKLLASLQTKFNVQLLPLFGKEQSRETSLKTTLQLMASADVFGGLHGAGLGHSIFLQPGSILFEMKDRTRRLNRVFLNMANLNDAGYYAFDTRPYEVLRGNISQRFHLNDSAIETITDGLWQAWELEKRHWLLRKNSQGEHAYIYPGACQFPSSEELAGRVSSFNVSRCYLHFANKAWGQSSGVALIKDDKTPPAAPPV